MEEAVCAKGLRPKGCGYFQEQPEVSQSGCIPDEAQGIDRTGASPHKALRHGRTLVFIPKPWKLLRVGARSGLMRILWSSFWLLWETSAGVGTEAQSPPDGRQLVAWQQSASRGLERDWPCCLGGLPSEVSEHASTHSPFAFAQRKREEGA